MLARADTIRQPAEQRRGRVAIQRESLGGRDAVAGTNLVCDVVDRHIHAGSNRTEWTVLSLVTCKSSTKHSKHVTNRCPVTGRGARAVPHLSARRRPRLEKPQPRRFRHQPQFRRVPIERLEPRPFLFAEMVLDIVPQVLHADGVKRRIAEVLSRHSIRVRDARVSRGLNRAHLVWRRAHQAVRPRTHRRRAAPSSCVQVSPRSIFSIEPERVASRGVRHQRGRRRRTQSGCQPDRRRDRATTPRRQSAAPHRTARASRRHPARAARASGRYETRARTARASARPKSASSYRARSTARPTSVASYTGRPTRPAPSRRWRRRARGDSRQDRQALEGTRLTGSTRRRSSPRAGARRSATAGRSGDRSADRGRARRRKDGRSGS